MLLSFYRTLSKAQRIHLITITMFVLSIVFEHLYADIAFLLMDYDYSSVMLYLIELIPLILTLLGLFLLFPQNFLSKLRQFCLDLRLMPHFLPAVLFAALCYLPVLIIIAVIGVRAPDNVTGYLLSLPSLIVSSIFLWAFLCDMNFKHTRLGFFPIVLLLGFLSGMSSIISLAETPSLSSIETSMLFYIVLTLLVSLISPMIIYWLYKEWGDNVWLPVMLAFFKTTIHAFIDPTALVDTTFWDNTFIVIFALPVMLSVIITVDFKRRHRIPFVITRDNVWMKRG